MFAYYSSIVPILMITARSEKIFIKLVLPFAHSSLCTANIKSLASRHRFQRQKCDAKVAKSASLG